MIGVFDGSDLTGPGAETADILVTAGYALPRSQTRFLLDEVRHVKKGHCGDPDIPVKWNLRGQKRALALHRCESAERRLIACSNPLRSDLLETLRRAGATLFMSVIHAYSYRRRVLVGLREDLMRFCFANLLMRVGLFRRTATDRLRTEVLLDWPESGLTAPYLTEYVSAWKHGRSENALGVVPYRCGALRDLDFEPAPCFAVTDLDVRLQLADLVVAVCREGVSYALDKAAATDYAVAEFIKVLPCFFRQGGMVMGRGITVAPTCQTLSNAVFAVVRRHA